MCGGCQVFLFDKYARLQKNIERNTRTIAAIDDAQTEHKANVRKAFALKPSACYLSFQFCYFLCACLLLQDKAFRRAGAGIDKALMQHVKILRA